MSQSLKLILQYHQNLASNEFVRKVLKNIAQQESRRAVILSLSTLIGLVFAFSGLLLFSEELFVHIPHYFSFSPIMVIILLIGIIAIFWDGFVELVTT